MSAVEKGQILAFVSESGLPRRRAFAHLGLPKSTFYRWLRRQTEGRLQDNKGGSSLPWNKLRPEEEERILTQARASPQLSARQLALKFVDCEGWYVSGCLRMQTLGDNTERKEGKEQDITGQEGL